jgi:hypothetical protein
MPEKSALLCIVKWTGEEDTDRWREYPLIEEVVDLGPVKGGRLYLMMGKEEPWFFGMIQTIMEEMRVFFNWPVILEPDRIEIRWIGYLRNISLVMNLFKEFNMNETITSIVDYDPSISRSLEGLTPRQYEFLMDAYDRGYYDDTRKVTLNQLSEDKGVSTASYMLTLRRAMRHLIEGSLIEH